MITIRREEGAGIACMYCLNSVNDMYNVSRGDGEFKLFCGLDCVEKCLNKFDLSLANAIVKEDGSWEIS